MKYRQLRDRATGQWVNVLFTVDADDFSVPELSHRTSIAQALGLSPDALETVEGLADSRTGVLITLPPPVPQAKTATELAREAAIATAASEVTAEIEKAFVANGLVLTAAAKDAMTNRQLNLITKAQGR